MRGSACISAPEGASLISSTGCAGSNAAHGAMQARAAVSPSGWRRRPLCSWGFAGIRRRGLDVSDVSRETSEEFVWGSLGCAVCARVSPERRWTGMTMSLCEGNQGKAYQGEQALFGSALHFIASFYRRRFHIDGAGGRIDAALFDLKDVSRETSEVTMCRLCLNDRVMRERTQEQGAGAILTLVPGSMFHVKHRRG